MESSLTRSASAVAIALLVGSSAYACGNTPSKASTPATSSEMAGTTAVSPGEELHEQVAAPAKVALPRVDGLHWFAGHGPVVEAGGRYLSLSTQASVKFPALPTIDDGQEQITLARIAISSDLGFELLEDISVRTFYLREPGAESVGEPFALGRSPVHGSVQTRLYIAEDLRSLLLGTSQNHGEGRYTFKLEKLVNGDKLKPVLWHKGKGDLPQFVLNASLTRALVGQKDSMGGMKLTEIIRGKQKRKWTLDSAPAWLFLVNADSVGEGVLQSWPSGTGVAGEPVSARVSLYSLKKKTSAPVPDTAFAGLTQVERFHQLPSGLWVLGDAEGRYNLWDASTERLVAGFEIRGDASILVREGTSLSAADVVKKLSGES